MELFKNLSKQVSSQIDQMKLNREIEALHQLVKENPQNVEALRRLAEAYQAIGNVEAAISHFIQLADLYKNSKQAELALAFYRKVERMVDSNQRATILKQMVHIYFDIKQFDRAYEHCRQVISLYVGAGQPEAATGFMKMLPEFGERDADYRKELREMIQERDERWMQGAKATWVDSLPISQPQAEEDFSDHVILLVDDEPHVLMILEKVIRPLGCQVMTANNGMEALEKARQQTPTIIISDLMMPKMDGSQLFAAVQQDPKLASVPFVCLTSRDQEDEKVSAFEKGVEDYWSKPFSVKEIPVRVKRLLRRTRPNQPIAGQLAATSVIDLLNQFERERKSGCLQIVSSKGQKGLIYFKDGTAVDAECGDKRGLPAIFMLVGWNDGTFSFNTQNVKNDDVIGMRASDLILEALRRFDEEQVILKSLPDLKSKASLPPGFNITWFAHAPSELVRKVLAMVDGNKTVGACVEMCQGDLDLLRLLSQLWSNELKEAQMGYTPEPLAPLSAPPPMTPPGFPLSPGFGFSPPGAPGDASALIPQPPPMPGYPGQSLSTQPQPPQGNWSQTGNYPASPEGFPPQGYPGYPPGYPQNPYPGYSGYPPNPYSNPYGSPYGQVPPGQQQPYPPGQQQPYPPGQQQPYPGMPYQNPPYPSPSQPPMFPSGTFPTQGLSPQPPGYTGGLPMGGQGAPKSPAQSVPPKSPAPTTPIDISMTFSDPQTETAQAQKLYEAVVSAKRQCGEPLDDFTFPRFHRILSEQSAKIKSQLNCSRVVFSVHVENGRVKFVGKGA